MPFRCQSFQRRLRGGGLAVIVRMVSYASLSAQLGRYWLKYHRRHSGQRVFFPCTSFGAHVAHTLCMHGSACGWSMVSRQTGHSGTNIGCRGYTLIPVRPRTLASRSVSQLNIFTDAYLRPPCSLSWFSMYKQSAATSMHATKMNSQT